MWYSAVVAQHEQNRLVGRHLGLSESSQGNLLIEHPEFGSPMFFSEVSRPTPPILQSMVRCAMSGQGLRLAAFHPNNGLQRCAFGPTGTMLAICCPSVSQPHPDQAGHPDKSLYLRTLDEVVS